MSFIKFFVAIVVALCFASMIDADEFDCFSSDPFASLCDAASIDVPTVHAAVHDEFEGFEYVTIPYESMNLTEPLDQFGEPAAVDLEPAGEWVDETYWGTECVGGVCRPVQLTRRVWRAAGAIVQPVAANEPYVTSYGVPIVSGVFGRLRARRFALRERWANRPRLFGRCAGCQ